MYVGNSIRGGLFVLGRPLGRRTAVFGRSGVGSSGPSKSRHQSFLSPNIDSPSLSLSSSWGLSTSSLTAVNMRGNASWSQRTVQGNYVALLKLDRGEQVADLLKRVGHLAREATLIVTGDQRATDRAMAQQSRNYMRREA